MNLPRRALAFSLAAAMLSAPTAGNAKPACTATTVKQVLDDVVAGVRTASPVPGVGAAAYVPRLSRRPIGVASGYADLETGRRMTTSDLLLVGSVGKTYFAGMALRLAADGVLDLDRPINTYLPGTPLPNGDRVTTRMLLTHTSGYPTYDREFMEDLIAHPLRERGPDDWFGPIRRNPPTSEPGAKFEYSDVNFLVLAQVIEGASKQRAYPLIKARLLDPLGLKDTVPVTGPRIPRLVASYAGQKSLFGNDRLMQDGALIYNPQFEWGGGGFASTPADLARWIAAFRNGEVFPARMWPEVAAPASRGPEPSRYGLGIHADPTKAGLAYGHSGYMPGYLSWVRWYERGGFSVAMQVNTSDDKRMTIPGYDLIDKIALRLEELCPRAG